MRAHRVVLVLLALALLVASCGIPSDREPRAISQEDLPPELAPTQSTTTLPNDGTDRVNIYFWDERNERLAASLAQVDAPATWDTAVDALLTAVSPADLQNEIASATGIRRVGPIQIDENGNATVPLSEEWLLLEDPIDRRAAAQLTFTITAWIPDISSMSIIIEDRAGTIQLPSLEGSGTDDVVSRSTYIDLAPPVPPG